MPTVYKVLGQSAPSATTNTNVYTVPAGTQTVVSTMVICNRGTSAGSYRVAFRPNGASIATNHYIAFDTPIAANDSVCLTLGITLGPADIITVYASSSNFSFSAFGSEVS